MEILKRLKGKSPKAGSLEPGLVNRNALFVEPKQAFVDWLNSCPDTTEKVKLTELPDSHTVVLIPEQLSNADEWLKVNYKAIFAFELESWYTDPNLWPKDFTFQNFQRFFNVRYASMVLDLEFGLIEKEVD